MRGCWHPWNGMLTLAASLFRFFGVDKMNARAGGFGLFAPGIDWSQGVEGRKNLEEMMRQHEAIEAADREHKRRARTQQSLSGLRFKL